MRLTDMRLTDMRLHDRPPMGRPVCRPRVPCERKG